MKFVVPISQCPIMMEFDGCTIARTLQDKWSQRIKLVLVTDTNCAGRIHDLNDIRTDNTNWQDRQRFSSENRPSTNKNKTKQLLEDLMRMARLRLEACDREGAQFAVETGIGLGVFAGRAAGIAQEVRETSTKAIRKILEKYESNYQNIQTFVFALPIF
ncbi:unnamed protein product [Rotaria socialis]|uniref:Uncharacterized protein n=1 Tax=Rotaria socialis TaxID=392032 RepID=A0A820E2Q8_9BILA|nr:unnamed protein product [Rotaria socialis]